MQCIVRIMIATCLYVLTMHDRNYLVTLFCLGPVVQSRVKLTQD